MQKLKYYLWCILLKDVILDYITECQRLLGISAGHVIPYVIVSTIIGQNPILEGVHHPSVNLNERSKYLS